VIVATLAGVTGTARLTVADAKVTGLVVSPDTVNLAIGASQRIIATATFSDGQRKDVSDGTSWSSSDATVAGVSNAAGSAGQVTGRARGVATITASYGGFTA